METDNHHNALKCPHCNPKGLVLVDMEDVKSKLSALEMNWDGDRVVLLSDVLKTLGDSNAR